MGRRHAAVQRPKNVDGAFALRTEFYRKYLRTVIKGLFEFETPEGWDRDYVLNQLVNVGYIVVTDTVAGVLALKASLYDHNYMNIPTKAKIVVPTMREMNRTIGKDCEVIYLERRYDNAFWNFREIVDVYASKLAICDGAIDVNIFNSKLAYLAEAQTKAQAETIKSLFDNIMDGEPLVVYQSDSLSGNPINVAFNNLSQNFIANDIQDAKRSIMNEFLTMIGLNNANTDKKERLIVSEVSANNEEIQCNTELHRKNLEECVDKVNEMFPELNLKLKYQFGEQQDMSLAAKLGMGGVSNDSSRNNGNMGNKAPK